MDRDLLSAVLGRRVWPRALAPAVLRGYRRSSVRGASHPVVQRERRGSVEGVILDRVGIGERDRLSAYEGDGYDLVCARIGKPMRAALRSNQNPALALRHQDPGRLLVGACATRAA